MGASDIIVKVGADLAGFKSSMQEVGGIAETSIKPASVAIDLLKKGLIGLGAALTTVSIIGARYEQTLIETATVAGAFGDELKNLENSSRSLATTTAFSAREVVGAYYDLACLPPGEFILGGDFRVHPIEQFPEIDIIGNNGLPQAIKEFTNRKCSEGTLYKIKPRNLRPFKVTGNHPIYAIKGKKCKGSICKPSCTKGSNCTRNYWEKYTPEWIRSEDLEQGDILLQPIIKEERDIPIEWDIVSCAYNRGFDHDKLPKQVDENFAYFLGLFLGNGWADKNQERVYCAISKKETEKWFIEYVNSLGYTHQIREMQNCNQICFWSAPIARLIHKWIGSGAENKRIPPELFYAKKNIIIAFLKGYLDTDGCLFYANNRPIISISTISPHIAYFINYLSAKIGDVFSIVFDDKEKNGRTHRLMPSGYYSELKDSYTIKNSSKSFISQFYNLKTDCVECGYKKAWISNGFVHYPILKIDLEVYYGQVYNFETEDNTYSTGVIVHNSSGMSATQIIASGEHAAKLAGATNAEMSEATHILASALRMFNIEADDSRRVTDTFTTAISKSLLTMDKLTIAFRYAGATGSSLGWSIEETTAAISKLTDLGLTGEIAGTNIRSAMSHLMRQTTEMTEELEKLGMTYAEINPQTKGFGDILNALSKHSFTAANAIKVFGVESGLNMKNLVDKAREGTLKFEEFVEMIKEGQKGIGTTAEMYDRMMDTFQNQWKVMVNSLMELALVFFDTFKEEGKDVFTRMAERIKEFAEYVKTNKHVFEDLISIMLKLVEYTGIAIVKLGEFATGFVDFFTFSTVRKQLDEVIAKSEKLKELEYEMGRGHGSRAQNAERLMKAMDGDKEAIDSLNKSFEKSTELTKEQNKVIDDAIETRERMLQMLDKTVERHNVSSKKQKEVVKVTKEVVEVNEEANYGVQALYSGIDELVESWEKEYLAEQKSRIEKQRMHLEMQKLIDDHAELMKELIVSTDLQTKYTEKTQYSFISGWKEAFDAFRKGSDEAELDSFLMDGTMSDLGKKFTEELSDTFGQNFYSIITGEFDSIDDAWISLADSMLKTWTNVLGDMTVQWLKEGDNWKVGVGGVLGGVVGSQIGSIANPGNKNAQTGGMLGGALGGGLGTYFGGPWGGAAGTVVGGLLGTGIGGLFGGSDHPDRVEINNGWMNYNRKTDRFRGSSNLDVNSDFAGGAPAIGKKLTDYLKGVGEQFQTIPTEFRREFEEVFSATPIDFGGLWESQDEMLATWDTRVKAATESTAKALGYASLEAYQEFMEKFEAMSQQSANMIADAFNSTVSADNASFSKFTYNLKQNIYESVKGGLLEAFMKTEVYRSAIRPFIDNFSKQIEKATIDGVFDPSKFKVGAAFDEQIDFKSLESIYNLMTNYLGKINQTLGTDFDNMHAPVEGRAKGGRVVRGKKYVVGEKGPEEFVPGQNGFINPNGSSGNMIFINRGVLTESDFFKRGMRNYQDLKQQDTFSTIDTSSQGIRSLR